MSKVPASTSNSNVDTLSAGVTNIHITEVAVSNATVALTPSIEEFIREIGEAFVDLVLPASGGGVVCALRSAGFRIGEDIDCFVKENDEIDGKHADHYAIHLKKYDGNVLYFSFDLKWMTRKALHFFVPFNGKYLRANSKGHKIFEKFEKAFPLNFKPPKNYQAGEDETYQGIIRNVKKEDIPNCSLVQYKVVDLIKYKFKAIKLPADFQFIF